MGELVPWRVAIEAALYGEAGFYREGRPAEHFRTSAHVGGFAEAVAALLDRVDVALGRPDPVDLVDLGSGGGELLSGVTGAVGGGLARRLRAVGVEVGRRPAGLSGAVGWVERVPPVTGLLIANEWLDNVPIDVVERDGAGRDRLVLVDREDGSEELGPVVSGEDAAWLARWWPLRASGDRAEIGVPRDAAWAGAVAQVRRGLAVAVDYGHLRDARPPAGTLTGYRAGRQVMPVPDGSCDLTAHVAVDALPVVAPLAVQGPGGGPLGAGSNGAESNGVRPPRARSHSDLPGDASPSVELLRTGLRRQRDVLRALGVCGARPARELATEDPAAYLRALATASTNGELTAPSGLGAFWWLTEAVRLAPG